MGKTINKDRNYILLNYNNPIDKNDLNNFYKLIEQRSLGKPVAYLTKKKIFLEFRIYYFEWYINSKTRYRTRCRKYIKVNKTKK